MGDAYNLCKMKNKEVMCMRRKVAIMMLFMLFSCVLFTSFSPVVYASSDMDGIESTEATGSNSNSNYETYNRDYSNNGVSNYLGETEVVGQEQMAKASSMTSGIVNIIGVAAGVIVTITAALIFVITALDLLYIAVPFTRGFLAPNGGEGGAASMGGGMGMGGMGGMRGGMGMGGMGMGGMGGMNAGGSPHPGGSIAGKQWVSDEALQSVMPAGGSAPAMGGGMGMGGMGGMGMGGMGAQGMGGQKPSTHSAIVTYFKKRVIFIIIFTVCAVVLMSSVFTDCGLNLAQLVFKIMGKVNVAVGNAG